MSETTPTVLPEPPPASEPSPVRPRGQIPRKYVDELEYSESIHRTASKPEYASTLATGMEPGSLAEFASMITATRELAALAGQKTTSRIDITATEAVRKATLARLCRSAQAFARAKYRLAQPAVLRDYFVGDALSITVNRARLEQCALGILSALAREAVPGMTPERVTALNAALTAFKAAQTEQITQQSAATAARRELRLQIGALAAMRRSVQSTADALWPPAPDNDAIRREFRIPATRAVRP